MAKRALVKFVPVNGNSGLSFFDQRPIELSGFRLRAESAEPIGHPTLAEWTHAMGFAEACEVASPYWVGDLQLYADERPEWKEQLAQALSRTKLARHTLQNLKSLSKQVGVRARKLAQSKSHAAEVQHMPTADQERWLEKSRDEHWTEGELRKHIKRSARAVVLEGQADTMHTIEVRVEITVEAQNPTLAEDAAWSRVKKALAGDDLTSRARVIAAHARAKD